MADKWLEDVPGIRDVVDGTQGDVVLPRRRRIRFRGGAVLTDDPSGDAIDVEIPLGGGGGDLPDIATDRLLGRDADGTGQPEQILVTNGLAFTGAGGIGIALNGVTDARLRDSAGLSVIGRSANTTGDPGDIVASGDGHVLRRNGSVLAFGTVGTLGLADQAVTNAKLANMASGTIKGRLSAGSGAPEDLTATQVTSMLDLFTSSDKGLAPASGGGTANYLRADGTWAAPPGNGIPNDNSVTHAKLADLPTDTLIGRDTAGTGDPENISVGGGLEFTGSGGIRRSALTGDVTASAGSNSTTIANNAVSNAKLRDSAGVSVIGRATNTAGDPADIVAGANDRVLARTADALAFVQVSSAMLEPGAVDNTSLRDSAALSVIGRATDTAGDPADIVAGTDGSVLRRDGSTLGFGQVDTGGIKDRAVTFAKLQDIPGNSLMGRVDALAGPPEAVTVDTSLEFVGTSALRRAALTGDVTAAAGSNVLTIASNAVSDAKLRDSAACSVIGRAANTAGDPADIVSSADGEVLRRSAGVLGWGTISTAGIGDNQVTFAKIQTIATDRLLGRDTALSGVVEELTVGGGIEFTGSGGIQRSALTGDVTAAAGSNATTIANDVVTNAKLRNSAALSVIGRATNTAGDPADIVAGTDGHVLRRAGTTLGFGQIATSGIADAAVTYAKIQNVSATDRLLGRDTIGTGPAEEITVGGGIEFTGSGGIQRSALTGDVTAAAGSNATTIANNAVSNAKLRDSIGLSVIGRSANSSGDPADIVAASDGHVLRRAGTTLGFGQIATAGITDGAVTYAKIQNVTPYSILGRQATAGPPQEITATGTSVVLQVDAVEALKFGKITPDLMDPMSEMTVLGRAVGAGTGSPQYLTLAQLRALLGQALPLFAGYPTNAVYAANTAMPITTTAANVGGYTVVGGAVQVPSSGTYEIEFVSERVDLVGVEGQARIDLHVGGVLQARMWGMWDEFGDGSVIAGKTFVNVTTPSTQRVELRVPSGFPSVDLTWGLLTIRRIPG